MAFPTTGLLDDFNRVAENPLANGTWSTPIRSGEGTMAVGSGGSANAIIKGSGTTGSSYWSAATFGPDSEVFCLMSAVPGDNDWVQLYARTVDLGLTTLDGYNLTAFKRSGADEWQIRRVDNGTDTVLGATATQEYANGDSIGFEIIGSTLTGYIKTAGVWSAVLSRTDATYSAAGNIGIRSPTTVGVEDDFSGGTVVAAGGATTPMRGLMGVGTFLWGTQRWRERCGPNCPVCSRFRIDNTRRRPRPHRGR